MKHPINRYKYKVTGLIVLAFLGLQSQAQQIANPALDTFTQEPTYHPAVPVDYPGLINLTNTGKFNYIQNIIPDVPATSISSSNLQRVSTDYFDGLGRLLQTVNQKAHADGRDLMIPHVYDGIGRETFQYQPFSPLTILLNQANQIGKLKLSANTMMRAFYDYQQPDQQPYSQTVFESSPLGRVVKQMAPGTSWVGSGRGITYNYKTNSNWIYNTLNAHVLAGGFPRWTITAATNSLPVYQGTYANSELYLTEVTDEDGKSSIEAKDKLGRVVMKLVGKSTTNSSINSIYPGQMRPTDYAYTFYVYDDLGNLRCVMPPMATTTTPSGDAWGSITWSISQDQFNGFCYTYLYDERNRVIEKKIPGKDVEYFVYDKRDRLIFRQDGNLRGQGKWIMTLYDALDRPYLTSLLDGPGVSRQLLTDNMNNTVTPPTDPNNGWYYILNYNLIGVHPTTIGGNEIISQTYYDDYSFWDGSGMNYDYSQFSPFVPVANNSIVTPPEESSQMTRGLLTGTRVRVLDPDAPGGNTWLQTVYYYDDLGRQIQVQSQNINNDIDIHSTMYYFQGQPYKSIEKHVNHLAQSVAGTNMGPHPTIKVYKTLTRNFKVSGGNDLVNNITQRIDDGIEYPFESIQYDHLGRTVVKQTPAGDILNEYNIRGFLNHIQVQNFNNLSSIPQMDPQIFEEKIYYDTGFANRFYNGNIAGVKWTMQGSFAEEQAYGYSYDSLNRLTYAQYNRINTGDTRWRTNHFDYTASNITYDLNGNIKTMNQRGNLPSPGDMDILTYKYLPNSNQLQNVEDAIAVTATGSLPDFKNNSVLPNGTEYAFDVNGNMTSDANKGVGITYNIFNKPDKITVTGKGVITYVYDGVGNRLQKRVHPTTTGPDEKWDYIDDFVYKNDSLQYILNSEGRARPIAAQADGANYDVKYLYDYFVKDHLGNVRSTVTASTVNPQYLAGFELSQANVEQLIFDNVATVRDGKPGSTDPEDHMAARLNADNAATTIGTSIMLKTMPGDKFNISVDALYEGDYQQHGEVGASDVVSSLMNTLTGGINYGGVPVSELPDNVKTINSIFSNPALADQINELTLNSNDVNAPKAHLNYLFFDDRFNLIASSSGSVQVQPGTLGWGHLTPFNTGTNSSNTTGVTPSPGNAIFCGTCTTPGYVIVYIDNQSIGKDVWFDHLMIGHYTSAVVAEDHYYPFGLTLNIDQNGSVVKNDVKFQSQLHEDDFGINLYSFKYRDADPQIGRFLQVDPIAEDYPHNSTYAFSENKVTSHVELEGLEAVKAVEFRHPEQPDSKGYIKQAPDAMYENQPVAAFLKDASWFVLNAVGINAIDDFAADRKDPANNTPANIALGALNLAVATSRGEGEAAGHVDPGVDLNLKTKANWSPDQISQAQAKAKALSEANTFVTKNPAKRQSNLRGKFQKAGNAIKPNEHVDHIVDLQLGGADDIATNTQALDGSVNMSLGSQINKLVKNLSDNTRVNKVNITIVKPKTKTK